MCFLFFKQKTAYEMRISDWSSDVCSSDLRTQGERSLAARGERGQRGEPLEHNGELEDGERVVIHVGSASSRRGRREVTGGSTPGLCLVRSEERRVGEECVSTYRSWWSPSH